MKSSESYFLQSMCIRILYVIVFCSAGIVESTSLMRRIRERQNTDVTVKKGLDFETEDWIHVPQPIQDVLMSIDDKLRSLDTFSYTLKLARLDFSLDQLVKRMENIETKFGRLETKFDVRMEKIEEIVISKDIKEEFSNEHLSRRMENLNEKINNKAAYLDAKLDIKLERILSKLEMLEREVHNSADDVLERLVKNEERFSVFESDMSKREARNEQLNHNIDDLRSFVKEDLTNLFTTKSLNLSTQINELQISVQTSANETHAMLNTILTERIAPVIQTNSNVTTISDLHRSRKGFHDNDIMTSTEEQISNLTFTLQKSLKIGEEKLKELDSDIELYTKKVIKGIQDLWQTSDKLKVDITQVLEQGNRSKELIHHEFHQLHERIAPLARLEHKLTRINDDFEKKIFSLSSMMDNNFATLLVSQNSFIASCQRIQEEEVHVYDILQQIIYEMRNRSVEDVRKMNQELLLQSSRINDSSAQILTTVLTTGNATINSIQEILQQHHSRLEECKLRTNGVTYKLMESLCNAVSVGQKISTEMLMELNDKDFMESFPDDQENVRRHDKTSSRSEHDVTLDNKSYDFLDYPLDNDSDYHE